MRNVKVCQNNIVNKESTSLSTLSYGKKANVVYSKCTINNYSFVNK